MCTYSFSWILSIQVPYLVVLFLEDVREQKAVYIYVSMDAS